MPELGITAEIRGYLRKCCSQDSQLLFLSKFSSPCTVPARPWVGLELGSELSLPQVPARVQKISTCENKERLLPAA